MKISKDKVVMAITALTSAAGLFAVLTTSLNAGQQRYGEYRGYGYGPAYPHSVPPGYRYGAPPRQPMGHGYQRQMQGYTGYPQQQRYRASSADEQGTRVVSKSAQTETKTGSENVTISNMRFEPATIRVKAGEKVSWLNDGPMPHTVTGRGGDELASGTLGNGASFSHVFDEPGSYSYYCSLHPSMRGTVIVE